MSGTIATRPFPHEVIRASAGTGKTFQLSNRFLALTCTGQHPDQILASTFARKAAGEILDRILHRLAEAACEPKKLKELQTFLEIPELDQAECRRQLKHLIDNLHRLRVGTLDAFFSQLAGNFGLELGFPPGWRIIEELDDQRLRSDAIQSMLTHESTGELVTLIRLLSKGDVARSVAQQIFETVSSLYQVHRETTPEVWTKVPRPPMLEEGEFEAAIERLQTFADLPGKRFVTTRDTDIARARDDDWLGFITKGLSGKIVAGEPVFYRKEIPPALIDAYTPLIDHAKGALIRPIADRTEAIARLLGNFDREYQRLKQQSGGMRFDDVTYQLAQRLSGLNVDSVAYRLDGRIAHLLLDEFQDTSLNQWSVMRPFAEEVNQGGGRSFFCVGDVKQAIYGWRGGVAEVFDAVQDQLRDLTTRSLDRSFRSAPPVIEIVNHVFENLREATPLHDAPRVLDAWHDRFQSHSTARQSEGGYCCLRTVRAADTEAGESQSTVTLTEAAAEVARLATLHPGRSIGVLVRKNSAVARLIYELQTHHQISASEEGGNPLTDSAAVELLLSLLTIADHPGDTIARFHVATSPLGEAIGLPAYEDEAAANRLSWQIRQSLATRGYGRTLYAWVQMLAPACDERELRRLLQLVEMGYSYQNNASARVDDFIEHVATTRVEDPTSADVRVMTVHQSKGLQFDIVVLPELDGQLRGQPPALVVGRPDPTAPIETVCAYANSNIQGLLPPRFAELFDASRQHVINESLCVLYVAMTRAVHELHMLIQPSSASEKKPRATFAGVLRCTLAGTGQAMPETTLFECGDRDWFRHAGGPATDEDEKPTTEPEPAPVLRVKLASPPAGSHRGVEWQSPSGLEGGRKIDLRQRLQAETSPGAIRGTIIHAWFEQIGWLEDGDPDPATLRHIANETAAPTFALETELKRFTTQLRNPTIRATLSQSGYRGGDDDTLLADVRTAMADDHTRLEACCERPFAVRDGERMLQGYMDRLVLARRDGQIVAADLIDFKTDSVPDEAALEERIAFYRPQLEAYRRALVLQTGLPPEKISARILFVSDPRVVAIPLPTNDD